MRRTGRVQIVALCGDAFYDYLTTNAEVRSTFLNWTAAADLRSSVGEVWRPFQYAGINWINYRGTFPGNAHWIGLAKHL